MEKKKGHDPYKMLLLMVALHFVAMFILTYSNVFDTSSLTFSLNKVYMAAIMTTPMILIEILLMKQMYPDKRNNIVIAVISLLALVVIFSFIRQQTAINDKRFLKSMIPHHSSAILMCERSSIEDQEIKDLCDTIVETQKEEINQMREILDRI